MAAQIPSSARLQRGNRKLSSKAPLFCSLPLFSPGSSSFLLAAPCLPPMSSDPQPRLSLDGDGEHRREEWDGIQLETPPSARREQRGSCSHIPQPALGITVSPQEELPCPRGGQEMLLPVFSPVPLLCHYASPRQGWGVLREVAATQKEGGKKKKKSTTKATEEGFRSNVCSSAIQILDRKVKDSLCPKKTNANQPGCN